MNKIAIRGCKQHPQNIIKFLESLGGINKHPFHGDADTQYYYIDSGNIICYNDKHTIIRNGYKCYNSVEEYKKSLIINYTDI